MTVQRNLRLALLRILVASSLVAGFLGTATPVRADHGDGTYGGNIGPPAGGTFSMTVSGNTVTSFSAQGMTGFAPPGCGPVSGSVSNVPIDTSSSPHGFSSGLPLQVNGQFNPDGTVSGSVFYDDGSCRAQGPYEGDTPCHCEDVKVNTEHRKNIFSFDEQAGYATSFFRATATVFCVGKSPPGCEADIEIQVAQGSKDDASIPKSERKVKCKRDDCPTSFQKKFEWRLRVFIDSLPGKGKIKKIRLRYKIECDAKTIFIPMIIAIKPSGRVDKGDSDFGNPPG